MTDTAATPATDAPPPDPLRWDPRPIPRSATDFVDGLYTLAGNGRADQQAGTAVVKQQHGRARIMEAQRTIVRRTNQARTGQVVRLLVDGPLMPLQQPVFGRLERVVDIDGGPKPLDSGNVLAGNGDLVPQLQRELAGHVQRRGEGLAQLGLQAVLDLDAFQPVHQERAVEPRRMLAARGHVVAAQARDRDRGVRTGL